MTPRGYFQRIFAYSEGDYKRTEEVEILPYLLLRRDSGMAFKFTAICTEFIISPHLIINNIN